jgi:hypothetical protein
MHAYSRDSLKLLKFKIKNLLKYKHNFNELKVYLEEKYHLGERKHFAFIKVIIRNYSIFFFGGTRVSIIRN